jgi:HYR domain
VHDAFTSTVLVLVVGLAMFAATSSVRASPDVSMRASGTLRVSQATLAGHVNQTTCPPAEDPSTICFDSKTSGVIRGLGVVAVTNLNVVEDPDSSCERWHSSPVLTVAGKGKLDLSVNPSRQCITPQTGVISATLPFTIASGSGIYAGATGHGTFKTYGGPGTTNRQTDTIDGTVSVPGLTFDLTPPVISGAKSKTVVAPKRAKGARVRYAVIARDGAKRVSVSCRPPSGSLFKVGRTRVRCRSMDASGNVATASFGVLVRRGR